MLPTAGMCLVTSVAPGACVCRGLHSHSLAETNSLNRRHTGSAASKGQSSGNDQGFKLIFPRQLMPKTSKLTSSPSFLGGAVDCKFQDTRLLPLTAASLVAVSSLIILVLASRGQEKKNQYHQGPVHTSPKVLRVFCVLPLHSSLSEGGALYLPLTHRPL